MLSRRAICLWLLAVPVCLGLAVSAAVLGQQPAADTSAADSPAESPRASAGVVQSADEAAAEGTDPAGPAKSRSSRRASAGGGRFAGAAAAGGAAAPSSTPPTRASRSSSSFSRLYGLRTADPLAAQQGQYGINQRYSYYPYTNRPRGRKPDPEMEKLLEQDAKMEQQARVFAKQFREAEDQPQRAKVRGNLEVLTKEHFDLRQKRRELELSRLEEQLERVRTSIKKRSEVKDLIIQRRVARLLGEEDDLAF